MLEEAGASVPDTQWEVSPTYSLAVSDDTMTESEIANAILQTASDEIVDGTAVYIDGTLRFVTTEGDHLRTYLESIKAPFENDMDRPSAPALSMTSACWTASICRNLSCPTAT